MHEREFGKTQQGRTQTLLYGPLIEQHDFEASGKDPTGLERWVSIVLKGGKVCVLVHANWYTRDEYTSRAETHFQARTPTVAPSVSPGGNACFWLGPYYPSTMCPTDSSAYLRTLPSRPGYSI